MQGSIPTSIQGRDWKSIDLSYNKLNGVLDYQMKVNGSISYNNNRLSGNIPINLKSYNGYVNILIGNIFYCSQFNPMATLPSNDNFKKFYRCGSNDYYFALIFSLIILMILYIVKSRLYNIIKDVFEIRKNNTINVIKEIFNAIIILSPYNNKYLNLLRVYAANYSNEIIMLQKESRKISSDNSYINILKLCEYFDKLFYCLKILILLIIFWFPVTIILNSSFNMYTFSYGFTVSNAFLTGIWPAVILFVFLLFTMIFVFKLFYNKLIMNGNDELYQIFSKKSRRILTARLEKGSIVEGNYSTLGKWCKGIIVRDHLDDTYDIDYDDGKKETRVDKLLIRLIDDINNNAKDNQQSNKFKILKILSLLFTNFIIVFILNGLFVWSTLNYSSFMLIFFELSFTTVKVSWNSLIVPYLSSLLELSNNEFVILSSIEIFNNIIIPFVATAMLSPNCFHSIFYVNSVESNYSFTQCKVLNVITGECLEFETSTIYTSFIPPFSYSYQW